MGGRAHRKRAAPRTQKCNLTATRMQMEKLKIARTCIAFAEDGSEHVLSLFALFFVVYAGVFVVHLSPLRLSGRVSRSVLYRQSLLSGGPVNWITLETVPYTAWTPFHACETNPGLMSVIADFVEENTFWIRCTSAVMYTTFFSFSFTFGTL